MSGDADRPNNPLLAIGIAGAGQAWLHRQCVSGWHSARLAAAVAALSQMNIVVPAGATATPKETTSASKTTRSTGQIRCED